VPYEDFATGVPDVLTAYGLEDGGVVLVRPDGHVAGRWAAEVGAAELAAALSVATGSEVARACGPRGGSAGSPRPRVRAHPDDEAVPGS
jgi:hypothetical protein